MGSILKEAEELINGQRRDDYGDVQESFSRIATIWSAILLTDVTPQQVALMMAGLKLARLASSPDHRDSYVDLAGYAALGSQLE
ncbi:hypothetical protein NCPPB3778_72 [Rathayibacter phage NCPPB3778]|nr:hypothetical protein NCPPB3778_72 [Rathayibacter phage NCPPB3778]